jgi:hypothetical protein
MLILPPPPLPSLLFRDQARLGHKDRNPTTNIIIIISSHSRTTNTTTDDNNNNRASILVVPLFFEKNSSCKNTTRGEQIKLAASCCRRITLVKQDLCFFVFKNKDNPFLIALPKLGHLARPIQSIFFWQLMSLSAAIAPTTRTDSSSSSSASSSRNAMYLTREDILTLKSRLLQHLKALFDGASKIPATFELALENVLMMLNPPEAGPEVAWTANGHRSSGSSSGGGAGSGTIPSDFSLLSPLDDATGIAFYALLEYTAKFIRDREAAAAAAAAFSRHDSGAAAATSSTNDAAPKDLTQNASIWTPFCWALRNAIDMWLTPEIGHQLFDPVFHPTMFHKIDQVLPRLLCHNGIALKHSPTQFQLNLPIACHIIAAMYGRYLLTSYMSALDKAVQRSMNSRRPRETLGYGALDATCY